MVDFNRKEIDDTIFVVRFESDRNRWSNSDSLESDSKTIQFVGSHRQSLIVSGRWNSRFGQLKVVYPFSIFLHFFHSMQHSAPTATTWSCQPESRRSLPPGRLFLSGPDDPRLRPDVEILVRWARPEVHLDLHLDRAARLLRGLAQSSRGRCGDF